MAGSAEFFAPLMRTVPCSGFPTAYSELVHSLSSALFVFLFTQSFAQKSAGCRQLSLRLPRWDSGLKHHQSHPQIVFTLTQSASHTADASLALASSRISFARFLSFAFATPRSIIRLS